MGLFKQLADRVDETTEAGGKFADALVRFTGATLAGVFAFVDRELAYAGRATKPSVTRRTPRKDDRPRKTE